MSVKYTLSMLFPDGVELSDIPIGADSSISYAVGSGGKHATQSTTVTVRDKGLLTKLFALSGTPSSDSSDTYAVAKIWRGSVCIFEGVVKPFVSYSAQYRELKPLTVTILDKTELMKVSVVKDYSKYGIDLEGRAVIEKVWRGAVIYDLVRDLFNLANMGDLDIAIPSSLADKRIKYFRLKDGDVLDEVISNLLYEMLFDFRFEPGKIIIYPIFLPNAEEASLPVLSDLRSELSVKKDDKTDDGISLSWSKYDTRTMTIYDSDDSYRHDKWIEGDHNQGYYYEHAMHETMDGAVAPTKHTATWDFTSLTDKVKGAIPCDLTSVVATGGVTDEVGVDTSVHLTDWDLTGGCLYLWYDGWFDTWFGKGWGFWTKVTALVEYKTPTLETKYVYGVKPKKITATYIDSKDLADALCTALSKIQKTSSYKYSFSSKQIFKPGAFVRLEEAAVSGLDASIRILTATEDIYTGIWTYTAEGAGDVTISPVVDIPDTNQTPNEGELNKGALFLACPRITYLTEEPANDTIKISADGYILRYADNLFWSFNGASKEADKALIIRKGDLELGQNVITCRTYYKGETFEATISLALMYADSRPVISEYKYSVSSTDPEEDTRYLSFESNAIFWADYAIGVSKGTWTKIIPQGEQYEGMYLWKRTWNYYMEAWTYELLTPITRALDVYAAPSTYTISKRNFQDTVITVKAIATGVWGNIEISADAGTIEPVPDRKNTWRLSIPARCEQESITITAKVADIESVVVLSGVKAFDKPVYYGIHSTPPSAAGKIKGDYYMDDAGVPKRWNGTAWAEVSKNDDNYDDIFSTAGKDWVKNGHDIDKTVAALYGYFEMLIGASVVADTVATKELILREGGAIQSKGYEKGKKGFRIDHLGDSEFNGTTIRGDLLDVYPLDDAEPYGPRGGISIVGYHPKTWTSAQYTAHGMANPGSFVSCTEIQKWVNYGQYIIARNETVWGYNCPNDNAFYYSVEGSKTNGYDYAFQFEKIVIDGDGHATLYDGSTALAIWKGRYQRYSLDFIYVPFGADNPDAYKAYQGVRAESILPINPRATLGSFGKPYDSIYSKDAHIFGRLSADAISCRHLTADASNTIIATANRVEATEILYLSKKALFSIENGGGWSQGFLRLPNDMCLQYKEESGPSNQWWTVWFDEEFTEPPIVVATGQEYTSSKVRNITYRNCEIYLGGDGGPVHIIAVGKYTITI